MALLNTFSMNGARGAATHRVAQAGVGLCAFVSRAFEKRPSSRGPFTGRRISLLFHPARPHPRNPFSNRSARRLEMPESYTKQRTDTLSNRHKFTRPSGCHSFEFTPSPQIHAERSQWALERALRNAARASMPGLRIAPDVESGTGWGWPVYLLPCASLHLNRRPDTIASPSPDTRFRLPSTRAKIGNT